MKNKNETSGGTQTWVYAARNAGNNPDSNVVMDYDYKVELVDGEIVEIDTIYVIAPKIC